MVLRTTQTNREATTTMMNTTQPLDVTHSGACHTQGHTVAEHTAAATCEPGQHSWRHTFDGFLNGAPAYVSECERCQLTTPRHAAPLASWGQA